MAYAETVMVYAGTGKRNKVLKILDRFKKISAERYIDPFCFVFFYAGLNEKDKALAWLDKAYKELKRNYGEMSQSGKCPSDLYGNPSHIIAYLRYYFFFNYSAMRWILLKNFRNNVEIIPRKDFVTILDFGAGPGTVSLAVCDFLEEAKGLVGYENTNVKLYFDEKIGDFAICYRKMLSKHGKAASIEYVYEKDENWKINYYDLVIISYVLRELDENMQQWLVTNVHNCLKNNGFLVIIEPAYKGMRKHIGSFLKNRLIRGSFEIVDTSGPLCSEESCDKWGDCYGKSIKRKKLKTPAGMTEKMKKDLEEKKEKRIKWVYAVLQKLPGQGGYVDPSELREYYGAGRENIKLNGWVINKEPTEYAENITFCKGLGCCNLAFWKDREVCKQVRDISEGDILSVEGELLRTPYERLLSVSVTEIIEHTKRVD